MGVESQQAAPVVVEVARVSRIVLNRPERQNAMNEAMGDAIAAAVQQLNASSEPRVVLVEGAGRSFSAGGDFSLIGTNAARSPEENRRGMLAFYSRYLSILSLRVPSIAVLHGAAVGAGLCLALACDLRLAASEAKLGANFVRVGLHPGMGCSLLLPRLVGPAVASDLLLSGRLVTGEEAARLGIVNEAVPRAELAARVMERAEQIATAAPIPVAQTKATLIAPLLGELSNALAREAAAQAIDFTTTDLREAVTAFAAGRPPEFTGR